MNIGKLIWIFLIIFGVLHVAQLVVLAGIVSYLIGVK
jgi:hypothetical protein